MRKNNKASKKKTKVIDLTNDQLEPRGIASRNKLKARSENQQKAIDTIANNSVNFISGPAGSGKTLLAVGSAIEALLDDKVNRIILTRPILEAGEKMGFIPGSAEEKIHPYLLPILDEISHFIPMSEYSKLKEHKKIEIVPLGHMRGRNFHNCFIVADECQNASYDQLKMLLTRIGCNSKMVITGDTAQSDLPYHVRGGFKHMIDSLYGIDGIGVALLENTDIVRNPIISKILDRLEMLEEKNNEGKKQ